MFRRPCELGRYTHTSANVNDLNSSDLYEVSNACFAIAPTSILNIYMASGEARNSIQSTASRWLGLVFKPYLSDNNSTRALLRMPQAHMPLPTTLPRCYVTPIIKQLQFANTFVMMHGSKLSLSKLRNAVHRHDVAQYTSGHVDLHCKEQSCNAKSIEAETCKFCLFPVPRDLPPDLIIWTEKAMYSKFFRAMHYAPMEA